MEFLFDYDTLGNLITTEYPDRIIADEPTWTNINSSICAVVVHYNETEVEPSGGFYQGMGYLIPRTKWIVSTAHIMQHSKKDSIGVKSERFYDLITGDIISVTSNSVQKTIGAEQSIDVTMHETTLDESKLKAGTADIGENVVVFQAIFTEEAITAHIKHNSKFVLTGKSIVAMSKGFILSICDGIIEHTAFTTKGSSGAPVIAHQSDGTPAIVGMSFYVENDASFAESVENIKLDMARAVPYLATENTLKNATLLQNTGRFNHYAFMGAVSKDTSYDEQYKEDNAELKNEVISAKDNYNTPSRLLTLYGDLVDKFEASDYKKKLVSGMIDSIQLHYITENYYTNSCKTLCYHTNENKELRFDKQFGIAAKFAIQPNSRAGKFKGVAQGIVYSQIIIDINLLTDYLNGKHSHITDVTLLERVKDALKKSLSDKGTIHVNINDFPMAVAASTTVFKETNAKTKRSAAYYQTHLVTPHEDESDVNSDMVVDETQQRSK